MTQAPTDLGQDPQYERFLLAPVGADSRGTPVTVLSMLARLGLDPWGEASDLAALSDGAARQRLGSLIEAFGDVQTPGPDGGRLVSGLLASLPRRGGASRSLHDNPGDGTGEGTSAGAAGPSGLPAAQSPLYWIVATVLILGLMALLTQGR